MAGVCSAGATAPRGGVCDKPPPSPDGPGGSSGVQRKNPLDTSASGRCGRDQGVSCHRGRWELPSPGPGRLSLWHQPGSGHRSPTSSLGPSEPGHAEYQPALPSQSADVAPRRDPGPRRIRGAGRPSWTASLSGEGLTGRGPGGAVPLTQGGPGGTNAVDFLQRQSHCLRVTRYLPGRLRVQ